MTRSVAELVAAHPLFADLDAAAVARVGACSQLVSVPAGRLLIAEGADADALYLVRRGRVSVELHAPGRGPLVVEVVGPGGVVGWSWLVPPYRWQFDGRALDDLGAVAVDAGCLRDRIDEHPAFGVALLTRLGGTVLGQLQSTRLRLADLYGAPR